MLLTTASTNSCIVTNILAVAIFLTLKAPKWIWDIDLNLGVNETNLDMCRQVRHSEGKNVSAAFPSDPILAFNFDVETVNNPWIC